MDVQQTVFLLVVCLFSRYVLGGEEVYSRAIYVRAYGNILKAMKLNQTLEFQNLTALLKRLELHDCSNNVAHRHKCVTGRSLLQFFNISTESSLKETDFARIAPVIVYALLPWANKPTVRHRYVTQKVDVYREILKRYTSTGFCEQILNRLLKDMNQSIRGKVNNHKCFSSRDILHEMNISNQAELTEASLPLLSTIIVAKLVNGHCIEVGTETHLPCPSYFVSKLFNKYANNDIINKENMHKLLRKLSIGEKQSASYEKASRKNNKIDGHGRHRRGIPGTISQLPVEIITSTSHLKRGTRLYRRAADDQKQNHKKDVHEKCYSVDELFSIYNVDEKTGVEFKSFQRLSAALLEQVESEVCGPRNQSKQYPDDSDGSVGNLPRISVWGFGFAAVSVVSLCSLVMIIPLMKTKFYEKSLVFLISLAVGTLVADAMFHLLPHATGSYSYKDKSYLWKYLSAVAGVYGLFFFETTTHLVLRKSHSGKHTSEKQNSSKSEVEVKQPVVLVNKIVKKEDGLPPEKVPDGSNLDKHLDMEPTIASMAWTVIIGDTLHNVADGIAIGVAFSDSITGGLSTSIAVLCHEVPHELGDFVVLLSAGMTVRQALLANFLSACFCFIGLILGKLIGQIEDVNLWILAITAGCFLYIALTNKLPELMHVSETSELPKIAIFILQHAGILLGFLGMLLLAYFKKDIDL